MKNSKKPFCAVPFTIAFTATPAGNYYRDCCSKMPYQTSEKNQTFSQWWHSDNLNKFRKKLLQNNEWPDECWACKTSEDQCGHSHRTAVNEWNITN